MASNELSPASCRSARALLKWSMRDLANASGVAFTTINNIEGGSRPRPQTAERIIAACAAAGVMIECGNGREGALLLRQPVPSTRQSAEAIVEGIVRIARAARRGDRESGIGGSQLSALVTIRYNPGITLKVLARLEGVAHPTMSRMVSKLVTAGWVRRARADDLRFQRLELSPAGHHVFEQAWERRVQAMGLLAERLQPSTAVDLIQALRPVAERMGLPRERLGRRLGSGKAMEPA